MYNQNKSSARSSSAGSKRVAVSQKVRSARQRPTRVSDGRGDSPPYTFDRGLSIGVGEHLAQWLYGPKSTLRIEITSRDMKVIKYCAAQLKVSVQQWIRCVISGDFLASRLLAIRVRDAALAKGAVPARIKPPRFTMNLDVGEALAHLMYGPQSQIEVQLDDGMTRYVARRAKAVGIRPAQWLRCVIAGDFVLDELLAARATSEVGA